MLRRIVTGRCVKNIRSYGKPALHRTDPEFYRKCLVDVHATVHHLFDVIHLFPQNRIYIENKVEYMIAKLDESEIGQTVDLSVFVPDNVKTVTKSVFGRYTINIVTHTIDLTSKQQDKIKKAKSILQSMNGYARYEYDAILVRYNLLECQKLIEDNEFMNGYVRYMVFKNIYEVRCRIKIKHLLKNIDRQLNLLSDETNI